MSNQEHNADSDAPVRVSCLLCGKRLIRDNSDDWRDDDGYTSCSHEAPEGPHDLHVPCVNPPGATS